MHGDLGLGVPAARSDGDSEMRTVARAIWSRPHSPVLSRVHKATLPAVLLRQPYLPLSHLAKASSAPRQSRLTLAHPATRAFSSTRPAMSGDSSFYSLKATLPGGKTFDFEQLRGKVVLIVNTASKWYAAALTRGAYPFSSRSSHLQRLHAPIQGP